MTEPTTGAPDTGLLVALLGLVGTIAGIIGGIIGGVLRPWGEDYINRKAEDRAELRRAAEAKTAEEATRKAHLRERLLDVEETLAYGNPGGLQTSQTTARWRRLTSVATDIGDDALIGYVGRLMSSDRASEEHQNARGDAQRRAGELMRELRDG